MRNTILLGDVRERLRDIPDDSVDCIVTSPPYWRQRDYGVPGQLGLESTPEKYIADLTDIFRECRRVLRPQGTCWVNIGDKWASGGNGGGGVFMHNRVDAWAHARKTKGWRSPPEGYKDKDLVGVPWMLAFAMRADGWYLRQCNIWAKPNCMPESVADRSTNSHEYVFHFSKSADYWYDADAVRTQPKDPLDDIRRMTQQAATNKSQPTEQRNGLRARSSDKQRGHSRKHDGFNARWDAMTKEEQQANGANLLSVWWISPAQYREAHYAVMPEQLAKICILAGCPEGGIVLDPFFGAGTTGLVALTTARDFIGIELNPSYVALAERRLAPLLAQGRLI